MLPVSILIKEREKADLSKNLFLYILICGSDTPLDRDVDLLEDYINVASSYKLFCIFPSISNSDSILRILVDYSPQLALIYPKMPELKPYKGDYYLWEYVPSIGASVVFLLFFLRATGYHCWKVWRMKARFCIAFCIGGVCKSSKTLYDIVKHSILTHFHY
jgi:hypothetical protein